VGSNSVPVKGPCSKQTTTASTLMFVTTVRDITAAIADRTKPETAADWDPVGLQLGDPDTTVTSVGVCHEVTEDVVSQVEAKPVDLLISYHPLLFARTNRIRAGRSPEARAFRLIRARVGLMITHTDFDAAPGGTADALATLLGLKDTRRFGGSAETGLPDIGRVGRFLGTIAVLDAVITDAFGFEGLRVMADRGAHVERVAVVPGAGGSFVEEAAELADVLVTGDVSHHVAVHAADLGLAIIDPGHTATERPGMAALVEMVREVAGVKVVDLTGHDPQTWG
jgi:dinuclear metal center YbgI/SA1388 family protein